MPRAKRRRMTSIRRTTTSSTQIPVITPPAAETPKAAPAQSLPGGSSFQPTAVNASSSRPVPADETILRAFAAKEGLDPKGTEELVKFAKEHRVSLGDLQRVGANAVHDTPQKKLMAMQTYAVAADAVANDKLSKEDRALFSANILPGLLDGKIKMNPALPKGDAGASYEAKTNTYTDDKIDLSSASDRSFTVHELRHAVQDKVGPRSQLRADSEREAYRSQCEYELREAGVLVETDGGVRIDNAKLQQLEAQKGDRLTYDRDVVYGYALENLRTGRGNLNGDLTVKDGSVETRLKDLGSDAAGVLSAKILDERSEADRRVAETTRKNSQHKLFATDVLPRDGW